MIQLFLLFFISGNPALAQAPHGKLHSIDYDTCKFLPFKPAARLHFSKNAQCPSGGEVCVVDAQCDAHIEYPPEPGQPNGAIQHGYNTFTMACPPTNGECPKDKASIEKCMKSTELDTAWSVNTKQELDEKNKATKETAVGQ